MRVISVRWLGPAILAFVVATFAAPGLAQPVPALPGVKAFVENLDLRCYQIPDQPPLGITLRLDHLNPVLVEMGLDYEIVDVREPQQLCVPVAKNDQYPPDDVLPFIRYVDWKCYGIDGPPLDVFLRLDHLNPQLPGWADHVWVREPQQLCVPVAKNHLYPPPEVLKLVEWLDVKCYRVEPLQVSLGTFLRLNHLNPLFADLRAEEVYLEPPPQQLCVPVAKNKRIPPDDVLKHVSFSDVLCYKVPGRPLNTQLSLRHLNPVLIELGLPPEYVYVTEAEELCVPVAKNGVFPPD